MSVSLSRITFAIAAATISLALTPAAAEGQFAFGVYLGRSSTLDSDVRLRQPGDTDLTFHDVGWYDESWVNPKYYGFRIAYWKRSTPRWGLMLDFTHAKIYAELAATVRVTGTRDGQPVDDLETLSNTFPELAMSHGLNTLTVNAVYRWLGRNGSRGARRLTPYVGFGIGIAVPHVEVQTGDSVTAEYQLAGPTVQGLGGLDFRIAWGFSIFAEYRINYANLSADLTGGGSLMLAPWTNHLSTGLTFSFR